MKRMLFVAALLFGVISLPACDSSGPEEDEYEIPEFANASEIDQTDSRNSEAVAAEISVSQ